MRKRFLCLGITLIKLGRGFSDMVVYRERTRHEMDHLLLRMVPKSVNIQGFNTHSEEVREQRRQDLQMLQAQMEASE